MSNVMNVLATSMRTDADSLRLIAQNVASADNVAYRGQLQVLRPGFADLADAAGAPDLLQPRVQIAVDTRPGTLKNTGEPLNLAIQGDAYFVVTTPGGDLLTRRGDLHVDANGVLSAFSGDPISGTEGIIHIAAGTPQIDTDGTVRVGADVVGHLRLVELPHDATLVQAGDGLFAGGGTATASSTAQVHQGFLETSNVSPVNQMVYVMQTMRHFEAGQRFVRAYDEMLDRAISDLGKV